jgi:HAE1 family hydrophobic/amphiphilic exporter-1
MRLTLSPGNASGETAGNGASSSGAAASGGTTGTSSTSSGPITLNLSDIAQVVDTGSVATQSSDVNGVPAIGIDVLKTTGGNTVAAADSVLEQMKGLAKLVPSDVTFTITSNQAEQVHDNVNDVVASLLIGALMAIAVVYIFLHNPRGTIIVAIAIPTSMIATFGPIYIFGFTLNTLSLLGLSLGIGVLVDDSIVVLENINRHLAMGEEPVVAAINGRSEIGYAALTLTAVDLVVFLPIAFMGGVIGQFFKSFGITVATATLFSMFVSFTLTPMLAARWYHKGEQMEFNRGFAGWFDRGFTRLEHGYQSVLRGALRHPWIIVFAGNLFLVLIFIFVGGKLGFRFAPDQDQNQVTALVQCPPGSSLAYTQRVTNQIERIIQNTSSLKHDTRFVSATLGNAGPGLNESGTQYAHVDLTLYNRHTPLDYITGIFSHFHTNQAAQDPTANKNIRTRADSDVAAQLNQATRNIPGAVIQASNVSGFGGGSPPLEVDLLGPNFTQLAQDAQTLQQMFAKVPGAYNIQNSFQNTEPEVDVRIDRQEAADFNLSVGAIGNALADAVAGNINSEYRDPATGDQYYIRVQLADYDRASPQNIANIIVAYVGGAPVHLGDVAQVETTVGPVKIDRYNRQREIAITAYMRPGYAPGNATLILDKELKKMNLGQVTYSFGGESRSIQQEGGFLLTAFLLGLILSYMLMAALFNNMVYPLSIGLSVPQAWAGGFIALFLTHESLNLIAMIGIIYLNAVVNKNAILVVDYTNTLRARGYKRLDALLEAGPVRLRPIMMTTFTIIVSTLPTAAALGQGAGFRQSLGIVVEGGIVLSLVLSLIMVPCAYLLFDNFTNWLGRVVLHRQIPAEALAYSGTDAPGRLSDEPNGYGPASAEPVSQEDPNEDREPLD